MAARIMKFVPAFLLLFFCRTAFSQKFPDIKEIDSSFYQTEVQITDVNLEYSAYATEYHSSADKQGAVKISFQGSQQLLYYDNTTVTEITEYNCTTNDLDTSEYDYTPMFHGWLNKDPIIIGPSAPLWYAQSRKNDIKYENTEEVRAITCHKFTLPVQNEYDDLTYIYYFAPPDWTTPYTYEKLRVPIRIRIIGNSSRYSAVTKLKTEVNLISDFAYFKPSIDDFNNLLPPIGLGCRFKEETDYMPPVPNVFQYSAEVVDLLAAKEHSDIEIQFQKTWYENSRLIARRDAYSRKKGFTSNFYDFNTGAFYQIKDDGSCEMKSLKDTDFQTYDLGLTSRIKTAKEVLNLDGKFYDMGKREIRGIKCDTFESVEFDGHYKGKLYYKLVVTAYFTKSDMVVGNNGEMESRIPVYYVITGYDSPENKTLQLQYNIFSFNDVVWPEMYSSFRLDRCYTKPESKIYFVLIIPDGTYAAKMEDNDELFIIQLRSAIALHARIPEMRIPYLKADYKTSGVYITGVMLERPPASIQFYVFDTGVEVTKDKFLKVVADADDVELCSSSCVSEKDFLCKGFYFCGKACFLKSTDPVEQGDGNTETLGDCTEYLRNEIESTNFRQSYLVDAVGYLEEAILAKNVSFKLRISSSEELVVFVQDIIVGDTPVTDPDDGKPYTKSVELRKLDSNFETVITKEYVSSLNECYKSCKQAGSQCSSFSYCTECTHCTDSKTSNQGCMISSDLVVRGVTKDTELVPDPCCNVYNLKFADYFIPYPEKLSILPGDKVINGIDALDKCALSCQMEKNFICRGFEYCKSDKLCTLHKRHILDLKPEETKSSSGKGCTHYAARYITDYMDMGGVLIDDGSNVRYGTSLEECAQMCSEDLKTSCKSFNYCPKDDESLSFSDSTCELSAKVLVDNGITTKEKKGCMHYEKRDSVDDWNDSKVKQIASGYTKKGFTGLVVGMMFFGIIAGALGFIFYSYMRSRSSGEGMAVRFMKNES